MYNTSLMIKDLKQSKNSKHQVPHLYKITYRFKTLIQLRYLIRTIYLLCSRLLYSQVNLTVQVIPTINMPPTVYAVSNPLDLVKQKGDQCCLMVYQVQLLIMI